MALVLYNTATRRKEPFTPFREDDVRLYVCGPTVYDYAHIGNARPVVVFDVLYRLLRSIYGPEHVTYARNITDVDDKIIDAAKASGEAIDDITRRTTRAFHEDMAALGALPPDIEPRATEHIDQMKALIVQLIERGHAYEADGHVLFHVPSAPGYGALSGRDRKEQIAVARVEVATYKKDAADFVLWKPSPPELPGWESDWGRGRPGWHVECSAMSAHHLGLPFDIHGGGLDLVFPHHENEIAQSTCAQDQGFVRCWMHNGFVTVEGEKMAKSVGNVLLVHDLLEDFPGEAIRLAVLTTHYRQPLDWTADGVRRAKANLDRLYTALRGLGEVEDERGEVAGAVSDALEDDLNTPLALSALYALATEANKATGGGERRRLKAALLACGDLLGLLGADPETWFKGEETGTGEIEAMIAARGAARAERDFAEADRIRDELLARHGVVVEDGAEGTIWRRAG